MAIADADELFSVPEVARRLKTNRNFVYELIRTGILPSVKIGRFKRVRKFAFNEFLKSFEDKDLYECVKARKSGLKEEINE